MAGESCHILYCLHLHASDRLKLARITARTAAEAAEGGGGGMTGEVLAAHNTEQVKMKIDEYRCTMKPVIDHYRYEVKRYHRVDCEGPLDDVKRDVMTLMQKLSVSLPPVFHSICESNKTREKDRVFRASIAASQLRGDMTDALAFARAKAGALNNRGTRRRLSAADRASVELESLIATHTSQEKRRESMGAVLGGFGANVSVGAKGGDGGGGFDAGMFTHNAVRDMVAEYQQKEAEAKAGGGRRRNRPRGGSGSGSGGGGGGDGGDGDGGGGGGGGDGSVGSGGSGGRRERGESLGSEYGALGMCPMLAAELDDDFGDELGVAIPGNSMALAGLSVMELTEDDLAMLWGNYTASTGAEVMAVEELRVLVRHVVSMLKEEAEMKLIPMKHEALEQGFSKKEVRRSVDDALKPYSTHLEDKGLTSYTNMVFRDIAKRKRSGVGGKKGAGGGAGAVRKAIGKRRRESGGAGGIGGAGRTAGTGGAGGTGGTGGAGGNGGETGEGGDAAKDKDDDDSVKQADFMRHFHEALGNVINHLGGTG